MRVKFFKAVCILLAAVLSGGCWDAKDINDRDTAMAVVVDFNEGEYVFYVEIAAIEGASGGGQESQQGQAPKPYIVTAKGKSFAEARERLDKELNKELFIGAVQSLMITPRMAERGIAEYIYRVRQMNEYRKTIDVIIIKGDPMQFLETRPENVLSVGFAVETSLEYLKNIGRLFRVSLSDVLEKLACRNDSYLLLIFSNETGELRPDNFAVFDGSKMVGEISDEETHGVAYVATFHTNPDFIYSVPAGNTHATIEAKMRDKRISVYYEENKIRFKLDLSFEGILLYPESNASVDNQVQQELKLNLENMIMREISGALITSRDKFGLDYLSLSETFRIKYPDIYKNMDWDREFKNAGFDINVNSVLSLDKTFDYDPEEKLQNDWK